MFEFLLMALAVVAPGTAPSHHVKHPADYAPFLNCWDNSGSMRGTGAQVGTTLIATASHVVHGRRCNADGHPTRLVYDNPDIDFALLQLTNSTHKPWPWGIDCGYAFNAPYVSMGYVAARTFTIAGYSYALRGGDDRWHHTMIIEGSEHVIPGMSGGPTYDQQTKQLAGLNLGYWDDTEEPTPRGKAISYIRMLADTPLCDPTSVFYFMNIA
jgi:hypothetical protein